MEGSLKELAGYRMARAKEMVSASEKECPALYRAPLLTTVIHKPDRKTEGYVYYFASASFS